MTILFITIVLIAPFFQEEKIMSQFNLDERITIQTFLEKSAKLKEISDEINKSSSSITREIRRHTWIKPRDQYHRAKNDCANRRNCTRKFICTPECRYHGGRCSSCGNCNSTARCKDYIKEICPTLSKYPHVCNGCPKRNSCSLEQRYYKANLADKEYRKTLKETREGFNLTEEELLWLNEKLGDLIAKQKQSIHHACLVLKDSLPCDERTIYNLIDANMLPSVKNIDLPRKCTLKPRKGRPKEHKVDRSCRVNRTYDVFNSYCKENDVLIVEMDTVEGKKGGKCIITFLFKSCNLQLYYLVEDHTSQKVIDLFNKLYEEDFGHNLFVQLFEAILTDNGTEFSNPAALEYDQDGLMRTKIFYCDPSASYQKGTCENNHEMLRRFLPKGSSFDELSQDELNIISSHINSYKRKKLNNQAPLELFSSAYGKTILNNLGLTLIPADKVTLNLSVIK